MMRTLALLPLLLVPTAVAHGGPINSGDIEPGTGFFHFVDELRTIEYHCHQHPNMWGKIIGDHDAGAPMANVTILDTGFEPAVVTLRYGAVVNWTNEGSLTHSVVQNTTEHSDSHAPAGNSPGPAVVPFVALVALCVGAFRRRIRELF